MAASVLAIGLAPAAASADQYVVDHCTNFDTGDPAAAFGTLAGPTTNTCGTPNGAMHLQVPSGTLATGATVSIKLSIPDDRPRIQMERVQTQYSTPAENTGRAFMPIFNHFGEEIFNVEAPASPVVDRGLPPGNRSLTWMVVCTPPDCTFTNDFLLNVLRTRLYLNEFTAPTVAVTGGTLTSDGPKSGLASVAFDAGDGDSGVKSVTVALGAVTVGTVEFPCPHRDWSACPRSQDSQLLQVDTTKVPNGTHEMIVTVRDAANNALTRSIRTVTVANGAAAVPNGVGASRLAKLAVRYTTTTKRSRRLGFGSRPTVKGTLVNEQGQPIGGAAIAILARPRQAGGTDALIAGATTGPDGAFSAKLPSGPSRTLTFAYKAFNTDAQPAASATLRTVVRASVSASMAGSVRAGRPVRMTGRLRLLGRAGIEIRIQALDGRVWRTTDVVRTTSGGRFRWNYRFKTSARGRTFLLRARVASQNYPFAGASSKPIRVRVR